MTATHQANSNPPSLVGSSVRSVDDIATAGPSAGAGAGAGHQRPRSKPPAKGGAAEPRGASIDELAREGALMGDDEYQFLDPQGEVVAPSQAPVHDDDIDQRVAQLAINLHKNRDSSAPERESAPVAGAPQPKAATENNTYSTPDLSQYQLDHQIVDHSSFVSSVESPHHPQKLPGYVDHTSSTSSPAPRARRGLSSSSVPLAPSASAPPQVNVTSAGDGLHTPYWHTDRDSSRSRARESSKGRSPSQSKLTGRRHLARGDNYKTVHDESPLGYEMPGNLEPPSEDGDDDNGDDDDRVTRHGKRTMSEKLAIAERAASPPAAGHGSRDPSLVTSGDYTNFNVDSPHAYDDRSKLSAQQKLASAAYLRSISRSRSRPAARRDIAKDEADPSELVREGALVNDDPYGAHLDIQEEA